MAKKSPPKKRAVGQTTAPKRVKSAPAPKAGKLKPQARMRSAVDRAIDDASGPLARRSVEALARPSWARFEAFQNESGTVAEIDLYDVIGTWELNARTFRAQLAAIKADRITVNINSPGGSVFDGFAMYQDLKDHPAQVHVRVRGIAASIASLIAMAGDTIEIADNGFLMIHNAWAGVLGDKREMASAAKLLGQIDKRLAATYSAASASRDAEDTTDAAGFAALMDAETWLDSEQAVALGLADSVGETAANAMLTGLDVSHFAKAPAVLKASSTTREKPKASKPAAPQAPDLAPLSAALARCIETLSR